MRFWRKPRSAERALDERGEQISRDLVERGLDDLDERSGFLRRLERRLVSRGERERRKA